VNPLNPHHPRKPAATRWAVVAGLIFMTGLGMVLLFLLTLATRNSAFYERNFELLVGINVAAAVGLGLVILWLGVRLFMRLKRGKFGSQLLVKLAAIIGLVGILPGLLIAAAMAGYIMIVAVRAGIPRTEGFDVPTVVRTTKAAAWGVLMPVVVLGGIYGGWFSPTEAGGVAAFYAMLVARFVYRSMSWREIVSAAAESAILSAKILIIVATAGVITWLLTTQGVPQSIIATIQALDMSAAQFLLCVNVLLLVTGCVLDPTSAILVLAPLLVPIGMSLGVDPIHFGVVMSVNLAIGMFTPPFGLNLFVAQSVTGVPAHLLYRGVWPFVAVQIAALLVITYVPAISLALGGR